jgi:CRISPR-associated protein Cas5d
VSTVRVKVAGPLACFTRPEAKVERVSYPVMTPSAARNILDAICWQPEMRWVVTSIAVLKPIKFVSVLRNEVQDKISPHAIDKWIRNPNTYRPLAAGAGIGTQGTQRNSVLLRDVAYVLEAYPLIFEKGGDNTRGKYLAMMQRRVAKGQCYHQPALGCREFAASFATPTPADQPISVFEDLGRMLYDISFQPEGNKAVFFDAALENGLMDTRPEVVLKDEAQRQEVLRCSYRR